MISEDDYRWLFRKAPIMATSIAERGVYLDVNDAMLSRLGYARGDMSAIAPRSLLRQSVLKESAGSYAQH